MTRVATYASRQVLVSRIQDVQKRLFEANLQVSTEKKAQDYAGIAIDSFRLVSFENKASRIERYMDNNVSMDVHLSTMEQSINSSTESLQAVRTALINFSQTPPENWNADREDDLATFQTSAFNAMKDLEYFLNANANGRYLFSGARTDTAPVKLPWNTLEEFQATFDGKAVTFPETRAANVATFDHSVTAATFGAHTESLAANLAAGDTGVVTFSDAVDSGGLTYSVMSAATAGAFADIKIGDKITLNLNGDANITTAGIPIAYGVVGVSADGSQVRIEPTTGVGLGTPVSTVGGSALTISADRSFGTLESTGADQFISATLTGASQLGTVTFATGGVGVPGSMTSSLAGAFSGLSVGMTLLVDDGVGAGTDDGIYTIKSVSQDGRSIEVEPPPAANLSSAAATVRVGVPDGTRIAVKTASGVNEDEYTVRWPQAMGGGQMTDATLLAKAVQGKMVFLQQAHQANGAGVPTLKPTVTAGVIVGGVPQAQVSAASYYQGDNLSTKHRIDESRTIEVGITAADGAVEKALRGLGIMAQGAFRGTENIKPDPTEFRRRVDEALSLINDALRHSPNSTEEKSDFTSLNHRIGYNRVTIDQANETHSGLLEFLEVSMSNMEDVNLVEAVTRLQDESRNLEVSYQTMARISGLSLANYI